MREMDVVFKCAVPANECIRKRKCKDTFACDRRRNRCIYPDNECKKCDLHYHICPNLIMEAK